MNPGLGRILVELAESTETIPQRLVDLINSNISPPEAVAVDDVFVRAMYVVSDRVNSYGGRFAASDHLQLAAMLVDSPVMVGHRKDKLPIARTFHAETIERDGVPWVKSYFYWLKSVDGAENLAQNIDGGIFKECSIAFTYRLPQCSICGRDIRLCEHEPFNEYTAGSEKLICHYLYKKLDKLLETSLVYRGANDGTSITRSMKVTPSMASAEERIGTTPLASLSELDRRGQYLVVPSYEGLLVEIGPEGSSPVVHDEDPLSLPETVSTSLRDGTGERQQPVRLRLIGMRGKQRCSLQQLRSYISGQPSTVSRLAALYYPDGTSEPSSFSSNSGCRLSTRLIPHRLVAWDELPQAVHQLSTRDGVEIWQRFGNGISRDGFIFRLDDFDQKVKAVAEASIVRDESGAIFLLLHDGKKNFQFHLERFDYEAFCRGRRFLARQERGVTIHRPVEKIFSLHLSAVHLENGALRAVPQDGRFGMLVVRPVKIGGKEKLLFYKRVSQE